MKYLNIAIKELNRLDQRFKLVAILGDRKPISVATNNLDKTHTVNLHFNPNRKSHAEVRCIRKTHPNQVRGATIYVYRMNLKGELALAKPCIVCQNLLKEEGVKNVYYTINNTEFGYMSIN